MFGCCLWRDDDRASRAQVIERPNAKLRELKAAHGASVEDLIAHFHFTYEWLYRHELADYDEVVLFFFRERERGRSQSDDKRVTQPA